MHTHALPVVALLSLFAFAFGAAGAQENAEKAKVTLTSKVAGTVVSSDGKPAADVEVFWLQQNQDYDFEQKFSARTDAQGKFRFAASRPEDKAPLSRRSVKILAVSPNNGLSFHDFSSAAKEPVTLHLLSPTTLRVGFLDPAGKPVPNLSVRVDWLFGEGGDYVNLPKGTVARLEQKTDAKGECTFRGLPQGMKARFAITDEQFASLSYENAVPLTATATQQAQPIRLSPGSTIEGRVTHAETGKAAADIRVGAQAVGIGRGGGGTRTDANGNYRLTNLPSGTYNVMLYLREGQEKNFTARALEAVNVQPNAVLKQQDFRLIPGLVLTGKVTDKVTGKPIEGVMIGVYGPAHPQSSAAIQSSTTDANGVYTARVPPGKQYVYVSGIPYHTEEGNFTELYERPKKGFDLTLDEDKGYTQDFTLQPLAARNYKPVRVRVVGIDGKPIANAKVVAAPISSEPHGVDLPTQVETDTKGEVSIKTRTASVRLRARSGTSATEQTTIAQNGADVTLTLKPNRLVTLSGRVVDDKGKPVPSAKVAVYEWQLDSGSGSGGGIPVDAQGRYTFTDLWADSRYSFDAQAPGYGTGQAQTKLYPAGQKSEVETITLTRADSFLAGRVVDANGDPVAKQSIMLSGRANREQETASDAQGKFRFEGLVPEPVRLILRNGNRFFPNDKRAQVGDRDVIVVKPGASPPANGENGEAARRKQESLLKQNAPEWAIGTWLNTTDKMPDKLKGKIVLIDFWATSCGPCVADLPAVQRVWEQYAERGVIVVGLHGGDMDKQVLENFVKEHKLTYPIAIDASDPKKMTFGLTMSRYAVLGIPEIAVLDRKGIVRYLDHGLDGAVGMIGEILAEEK